MQAALISKGVRGAITLLILGNGCCTPTPMPTRRLNNLLVIYDSIRTIVMMFVAISMIGTTRTTRKRSLAASSMMKHGAILMRCLS